MPCTHIRKYCDVLSKTPLPGSPLFPQGKGAGLRWVVLLIRHRITGSSTKETNL